MASGTIGTGGGVILSLSGVGATFGVTIAGAGAVDFAYGTVVTGNSFVGLLNSGKALLNMSNYNKSGSNKAGSTPKEDLANKTAEEIISKHRKGGIRGEFPGELLDKTYAQIEKLAKAGNKAGQTAKKLLNDGRFKK